MSHYYKKFLPPKNRRCHWFNDLGWPRPNPDRPSSSPLGCTYTGDECFYAHPNDVQWAVASKPPPPPARIYQNQQRPRTPEPQQHQQQHRQQQQQEQQQQQTPPAQRSPVRVPKLEHQSPRLSLSLDPFPQIQHPQIRDQDREEKSTWAANASEMANGRRHDLISRTRQPSPSGSHVSDSISATRFSHFSPSHNQARDRNVPQIFDAQNKRDDVEMDVDRDKDCRSTTRERERDRNFSKERDREYDRPLHSINYHPFVRDRGWHDRDKGRRIISSHSRERDPRDIRASPDRSVRSPSPRSRFHQLESRDERWRGPTERDRGREDFRNRERSKPVPQYPPPRPPSAAGSVSSTSVRKDTTPTQTIFMPESDDRRDGGINPSTPLLEQDRNVDSISAFGASQLNTQPQQPTPTGPGAHTTQNFAKSRSSSVFEPADRSQLTASQTAMPPPLYLPPARAVAKQSSDVSMTSIGSKPEDVKAEFTKDQRKDLWRRRIEILAESVIAQTSRITLSEELDALRSLEATPRFRDMSETGRSSVRNALRNAEKKQRIEEQRVQQAMEKLALDEFWPEQRIPSQAPVSITLAPSLQQNDSELRESGEITPPSFAADSAEIERIRQEHAELVDKVKKIDATLQEWVKVAQNMGLGDEGGRDGSVGYQSEGERVPRGTKRRRVARADSMVEDGVAVAYEGGGSSLEHGDHNNDATLKHLTDKLAELDSRVAEVENTATVWENDLEAAVRLRIDDLVESVQDRLGIGVSGVASGSGGSGGNGGSGEGGSGPSRNLESVDGEIAMIGEEIEKVGGDVAELADDMIALMNDVHEGKRMVGTLVEENGKMREALELLQTNQEKDRAELLKLQVEVTTTRLETDNLLDQIESKGLLGTPSATPSTTSTFAPPTSDGTQPSAISAPPPLPKDLLEAHLNTYYSANYTELTKALEEGREKIEKVVSDINDDLLSEVRDTLSRSMKIGNVVAEWMSRLGLPEMEESPELRNVLDDVLGVAVDASAAASASLTSTPALAPNPGGVTATGTKDLA